MLWSHQNILYFWYFLLTSSFAYGRTIFSIRIIYPNTGAVLEPSGVLKPSIEILDLVGVSRRPYELCFVVAVSTRQDKQCMRLDEASTIDITNLQEEKTHLLKIWVNDKFNQAVSNVEKSYFFVSTAASAGRYQRNQTTDALPGSVSFVKILKGSVVIVVTRKTPAALIRRVYVLMTAFSYPLQRINLKLRSRFCMHLGK